MSNQTQIAQALLDSLHLFNSTDLDEHTLTSMSPFSMRGSPVRRCGSKRFPSNLRTVKPRS